MIYKLRKKFILVSAASLALVLVIIYMAIFVTNRIQLNAAMDALTNTIAANNGIFPQTGEIDAAPYSQGAYGLITEETPHSTRFFTVWLDASGSIRRVNTDFIYSVSREQVTSFVSEALVKGSQRGWLHGYRYKLFDAGRGESAIVFVNGEMTHTMSDRFLVTVLLILLGSGFGVLILIMIISKRVVRPVAESHEKQKQFITDANHELKTPLTLIMSDLDIVESEIGQNEWLDDMRAEGEQMKKLINQLVMLSRMDEEATNLDIETFDIGSDTSDIAAGFEMMASEQNKTMHTDIESHIEYTGDETLVCRLISILLDNAVKYCDADGVINVAVYKKRHPVIIVENTYKLAAEVELDKLFDRFYRADKARTYDGSFGVGLSIAKAIVNKHHGSINAYRRDGIIGFKAELR